MPSLELMLTFFAAAAYLVYLGARLIFQGQLEQQLTHLSNSATQPIAASLAFRNSVVVEILNPKTALFYLAFLPQFTDAAASLPLWGQLLVLGVIVNVMFSSADLLFVLLAHQITQAFNQSADATLWMQRIGGGLLVALGLQLGLSR